jgi:glutaminase
MSSTTGLTTDEASTAATASEVDSLIPDSVEVVCKDVLRELYFHILREQRILRDGLTIGHVIQTLGEEGILFWRDERFSESQNVALGLVGKERSKYTNRISVQVQEIVSSFAIEYKAFVRFISPCARLFLRMLSEETVIPHWSTFCTDMTYHFYAAKADTSGQNAQYIPILRDANPDKFGLAVCSTDGQRFNIGDADAKFSLQSVSKPVTYALGLAKEGDDFMDEWIGVEPAGRPFNTQDLNEHNCPFNSSVNSGAIMAAAVFASSFPALSGKEVVDKVRKCWYELCGNDLDIGFSQATFDSERATAFNNFAIAYNLKGRRGLPRDVDLHTMLDVYLGCCSIEITCEALSVAAATLANGGICPITGKEVFPAHVTRTVLSEMMTCGMYDQAGRFAVEVGIPSKSGVSGALMVIVPNVFGFAVFSPRLNQKGNSVRGIAFCRRLVDSYRVHIFEPLRNGNTGAKVDPRRSGSKKERTDASRMVWAVEVGDKYATRLRDVFLFALFQTAAASPQGLSDRMLALIARSYEQIYHADSGGAPFQSILEVVRQNPDCLRFLEDLTKDIYIVDSHRSVVIFAMLEIITNDGRVEETEKNIAIRIAGLLGVDKRVALMEINRYGTRLADEQHILKSQELSELIDNDMNFGRRLGQNTHQNPNKRRKVGHNEGLRSAIEQFSEPEGAADENMRLRQEIFRLRKKVSHLTELLDDQSKGNPASDSDQKK